MNASNEQHITPFIGLQILYTYENGWCYEIYIKQHEIVDYRIHSGKVGGRWAKDQKANIAFIAKGIYKVSWDEPTGTIVCLVFNLNDGLTHGSAFFPQWVKETPEKTVGFQNDHLAEMIALRDQGPTYSKCYVHEYSKIEAVRHAGAGNETVIDCSPDDLPSDYLARLRESGSAAP